jgi:hypothetical protein
VRQGTVHEKRYPLPYPMGPFTPTSIG